MFNWIKGLFIKREIRYGCGSGVFYNPFEKTFYEACKKHDIEYRDKKRSRKDIDNDFLNKMLNDAANKGKIHIIRAYIYYIIARVFGSIYW